MADLPEDRSKYGAVTFLDVLGWKGKWRDNKEAIDLLKGLIDFTKEQSEMIHESVTSSPSRQEYEMLRGRMNTEILSISDTIVLFTEGPALSTLDIHGQICKKLLPESLKNELPLRGASAYGEFSRDGNIMIGPAIDEAASWHEATNWIGVHLTPSALYELKGEELSVWEKYDKIPFKRKISGLERCINWELKEEDVYDIFNKMGPHVPEIAEKYLNTHKFLSRGSQ